MTPLLLLKTLAERGVTLTPAGDRLRLATPKGVLTDELCQQIRTHKAALLALLAAGSTDKTEEPVLNTPDDAQRPCVVCQGTSRWLCGTIWRCNVCWPEATWIPLRAVDLSDLRMRRAQIG